MTRTVEQPKLFIVSFCLPADKYGQGVPDIFYYCGGLNQENGCKTEESTTLTVKTCICDTDLCNANSAGSESANLAVAMGLVGLVLLSK